MLLLVEQHRAWQNDNMHANSAKIGGRPSVVFVAFDRVKLLDITGPLQVMSDARRSDGSPAYQVHVCSELGGDVATDTVVQMPSEPFSAVPAPDMIIIPGGAGTYAASRSTALADYLEGALPTCQRLCSVCMGALVLAAFGHLDGRRATTHWQECEELAIAYPNVDVQPDAIFVEDGPIWTSAGVSAGIDMALALVERDLGREEALRLARLFVLPLKRHGGQSQFSTGLRLQSEATGGRLDALLYAIHDHPGAAYSVPEMAERAHMSPRHFARLFKKETGVSPANYVEQVRVDAAQHALVDQGMAMKQAALQFGFGNEETMRRAFKRQLGVTAGELRARFSAH